MNEFLWVQRQKRANTEKFMEQVREVGSDE